MPIRKILVCGATGQQGSAVVNALLACPPPYPHEILALTRNPASDAAHILASKSKKITLLAGDLNDCHAIFSSAGGPGAVYGVFSVQLPAFSQKNVPKDIEEQQGIALIDAALEAGVQHFVYSSVDRGGINLINDPTWVPHFASKHKIEKHLLASINDTAKNRQHTTYTILRPTAFYENLTPDIKGKVFAAMWRKMGVGLQLVSTHDIGVFAALAFADPVSPVFRNNAISLAGDKMTQAQASDHFQKVFSQKMPIAFSFLGYLTQFMIKELGMMFQWFREVGYKADVEKCRQLHPAMQNFETWLMHESKFKK